MIVDVAVPYRVSRTFHYETSLECEGLQLGSLIQVPFRKRSTFGFVLGFPDKSDFPTLKTVERVLIGRPLFDEPMLQFLKWVSSYYCHPLGEVIAAAIPKAVWERELKNQDDASIFESTLESGFIDERHSERPELTAPQKKVLAAILEPDERPVLLHGVTGSGKTEVYMQAIQEVRAQGKTAIVLAPEISLTPQLLGRFSARFPGEIAVLHSELTPKERFIQWQRVLRGKASIVIGARSAIFAPVKNLGLIVVDEEQESTFKQEDSLRYNARDLAIVRAKMQKARVILGSATPSVESMANALDEKYRLLALKDRVRLQPLPKATFVDLRDPANIRSKKNPWLSHPMIEAIERTLKKNEQTLLYLNRLGYAHFLYCQDCGHTWRCRQCDVSLTYYRNPPGLKCHYCNFQLPPPETCEACSGTRMQAMGVGTEQVEHALRELFPEARISRMDRSVVKGRKALETLLSTIANRQTDIVIGTQMITKGHDFPGVSLVGILVADASLNLPDFRAYERTFQILTQVSGRAGRADTSGEVIIQTINPEHPVLKAAANHEMEKFYKEELELRKTAAYPPYVRLAAIRFQHKQAPKVEAFAKAVIFQIHRAWPNGDYQILGPGQAPLSKLKSMHRWHCLIKSKSVKSIRNVINIALDYAEKSKSNVQMAIDVDPVQMW